MVPVRSIERMTGVHRDTIMRLGYAWRHETGDPEKPSRKLHIPPVTSPQTAVKAAIVQEFKEHGKAN
jgi:hypothetical protein